MTVSYAQPEAKLTILPLGVLLRLLVLPDALLELLPLRERAVEKGCKLVSLVRETLVLSRRIVRLGVRWFGSLRDLGLLLAASRDRRADIELRNRRTPVVQLLPVAEARFLRLVL